MTERRFHPVSGRPLFAQLLRDLYKDGLPIPKMVDHVYPPTAKVFTEEMIARAADYAHREGTGTYAEYAGEMVIGTDFGDQPGTTVYQVFEKRGDTIVAKGLIREMNDMMECAAGHKLNLRTAPPGAHQAPLFRKNAFVRDHAECVSKPRIGMELENGFVLVKIESNGDEEWRRRPADAVCISESQTRSFEGGGWLPPLWICDNCSGDAGNPDRETAAEFQEKHRGCIMRARRTYATSTADQRLALETGRALATRAADLAKNRPAVPALNDHAAAWEYRASRREVVKSPEGARRFEPVQSPQGYKQLTPEQYFEQEYPATPEGVFRLGPNSKEDLQRALDRVAIQLDRARDEGNGDSFDTVEQLVDRYLGLVHQSSGLRWEQDRHPVLSNSEARVASLEIQLRAARESLALRDEQLKDAKEDLAHNERANKDLADKLAASFKLTVDLRAEVMNLKAAHVRRVEEITKLENTLGEVVNSRLGIKPELQVGIQDMSGDDL